MPFNAEDAGKPESRLKNLCGAGNGSALAMAVCSAGNGSLERKPREGGDFEIAFLCAVSVNLRPLR